MDLVPSLLRLCQSECNQIKDLTSQIGLLSLKDCPTVLSGHLDRLIVTLQAEGHTGVVSESEHGSVR